MRSQQAILTNEGSYSTRTKIFLALNIIGALACIFLYILLTLAAMGVIFQEADVPPVVSKYLRETPRASYEELRRFYTYDE